MPVAEEDHVGLRRRQWARELLDADTRGMAVLGRARWITLAARPAIESVFARHQLDTGEFDVLSTLLRAGAPYRLRPTDLYRSLMISSGGLTDRLARLEKAGLIERVTAEKDGRSLPVQLTDEGKRRAEAAFRDDMRVEAELLGALSEDEQLMLASLLAKLAASLMKSVG
ncbi:MarR family winged helix-turn-helix transcriptional regulator [Sphingosinicella sp. BN140058]|uniref:MarR family winged helix-turn-helix transcriptional regulator n=1 Tax=Sphingosinicella sp. BN140058 TaxID=1892855 RepID=UPI001FB12CED|nr:MarR family transcriptional regulator [Sphingosinicella sp. BN140058]